MLKKGAQPKPGSGGAGAPGAGVALQLGGGGGQVPDAKDGDTGTNPQQLNGGGRGGVTVATLLVEGEAPSGEARTQLRQAVEASARQAESELQNQRVPVTLRQVARDYFDRLQGRSDD
ncbi:MAG: hypothetical protein VX404_00585 [Planctomycetota bacterium]|nr:hypothetical protein [Planctomycetota bacterium]